MSWQPQVTIRRMAVSDVEAVHALDEQSFPLPWPKNSYYFELRENPASRCWVAEVETPAGEMKLAAMLVLWLILDEAHIATLAVHPDERRRYIGQHLLARALLDASKEGAQCSFLEVRRGNAAAQALYYRFGYEVTSVRSRYYRDNGEDALLMTLYEIQPQRLENLLTESS